jgi:hypothetical protein
MDERDQAIVALVELLRPILAAHPSAVQRDALADCVTLWLAGHHVTGDERATRRIRSHLLDEHCARVRVLLDTLKEAEEKG